MIRLLQVLWLYRAYCTLSDVSTVKTSDSVVTVLKSRQVQL